MKRLFLYLLKKYSKRENDRKIIYEQLWDSVAKNEIEPDLPSSILLKSEIISAPFPSTVPWISPAIWSTVNFMQGWIDFQVIMELGTQSS